MPAGAGKNTCKLSDAVNLGLKYIHHCGECYSVLNRNKLSRHEMTRRNLSAYYQAKEANWKRLLHGSMYVHNILKKAKQYSHEEDQQSPGVVWKEGWIGRAERIFRAVRPLSMTLL